MCDACVCDVYVKVCVKLCMTHVCDVYVKVCVKVCMTYVCGCMCGGVCEGVWDVYVKVCVKVCMTHVCDVYVKVCACTSVYTEHFSVNTRMYKLVPKTQCHKSSASQ